MRVLIIGAGQVGTAVSESLHADHDVTVVDLDAERLNALSYRYDILTIVGDGTSRAVLEQARVRDSDLIIASTDRDAVNVVVALQVRALSKGTLVARTQSVEYLGAWRDRQFDVDHMVSSEVETAEAVGRFLSMPSAIRTESFAGGRVHLVEFAVAESHGQVAGRTLAEARIPDESVVGALIRDGRVVIPGGADRIEVGDRIVLLASREAAAEWAGRLSDDTRAPIREVIVAGGNPTGRRVAALLAAQRYTVRLVEPDRALARRCAEELSDVTVLCADATDPEFMARENAGRADALVACTDDDADDLLAGLLAKQLGVGVAVTIVNDPAYIEIFEGVGIDHALNQRLVTAEEIIRFARDPRAEALAILEDDRAEVFELQLGDDSKMLGRPFRERPLPGAIVGAIIRQDRVIFPRGDDALQPGDRVVLLAETARAKELQRIL